MMCATVSQSVCDSSITFWHDGVKYFENFAIVGISKHLSIMKHTFVTTEPCRSRKLSLSEQTVIINDERSVLADWVSNPQFAGLNMAGLKRNHCNPFTGSYISRYDKKVYNPFTGSYISRYDKNIYNPHTGCRISRYDNNPHTGSCISRYDTIFKFDLEIFSVL